MFAVIRRIGCREATQLVFDVWQRVMNRDFETISDVCGALGEGDVSRAKAIVVERYPFEPMDRAARNYTEIDKTRIFLRDGFTDRYSGEKLVFPPVLRLISMLMPDEFPFHKNWKMSECHIAYWQLLPTIDHVVPVSRGGLDEESNWVSTSQLRNNSKANWLLEELDWKLHEPGDLGEWDGLIGWFIDYVAERSDVLGDGYIASWHRAAVALRLGE